MPFLMLKPHPIPRQAAADGIPCQTPLKVSVQSDFAETPRKGPYVSPCTNGVLPWELGLSIELLPGKQQLFLEQLESPELPTNWVTACEQTKGGCLCLQHTRLSSAERAVRRASTLHFREKPSWALACGSSTLALTVTWPTSPLPLCLLFLPQFLLVDFPQANHSLKSLNTYSQIHSQNSVRNEVMGPAHCRPGSLETWPQLVWVFPQRSKRDPLPLLEHCPPTTTQGVRGRGSRDSGKSLGSAGS